MSTASAAKRMQPRPTQKTQYQPTHKVRVVTAASLFDGHDAAINIMRRILQASGAEVVHLGHNRSVREIVDAAIQEDAQGIAVSSYQGGHMEYFKYMRDLLVERGAEHVRIFGGGGGTIIPEEKRELEDYGIARIFHPEDGRRLGLQGMIDEIMQACDYSPLTVQMPAGELAEAHPDNWGGLARLITLAEAAKLDASHDQSLQGVLGKLRGSNLEQKTIPVLGITGTGGAGKSTITDELVRRYVQDFADSRVAVLSVDPTRKRTGGALLGDRIRMNTLAGGDAPRVFMRSLATRGSGQEVSEALDDAITICKLAGFDLIIAETSGIGQADSAICESADLAMYVMTPEFGAQSQLEKIEMLDLADLVVVNKFDRPGAEDALRDVRKAYQREQQRFEEPPEAMPVHAAMGSQFNDRGVNQVYAELLTLLADKTGHAAAGRYTEGLPKGLPDRHHIIPPERVRYLAEISGAVRGYKRWADEQGELAGELWALKKAIAHLQRGDDAQTETTEPTLQPYGEQASAEVNAEVAPAVAALMQAYDTASERLDPRCRQLLGEWPELAANYRGETFSYQVRGRTFEVENTSESLSQQQIPKVALPRYRDWGNLLRWRLLENVPGSYPFTAGVFPFKRAGEDPTRMFAGEGGPWRTNKRFHYLSRHADAKRLSTAFDSVTLYGEDPDRRPDIWGKVGNSGVSIATVEDMEALYAGFDLTKPTTSVSMTINGPAPAILAFYFATATRQALRRYLAAAGKIEISDEDCLQPDGGGYSFAELRALVTDEEYVKLRDETVAQVRGTVQADILKEDQAQNTCIFSTEFALRMQGDMQQWFIDHAVRNFYSVSISGYHIAEAGANPITQLALTLANGFTFVEYFRARGMDVNAFAPNLSFFFSNGMDPEYAVIGRVARRIWATAMRDLYGADERSQKLKYHIQTSGRSLHAQEIAFNDIRTTLQALLAIYDNCNSLHTNAYDEAITTPTEESVRRALAIQLVISREFGLAKNENPGQGAFIIDDLTELVEEAVLREFERISERGGVLGAMERMYQRSKIQEESLYYEHKKHSGELPIIGVNTFTAADERSGEETTMELIRSTEEEKEDQLSRLSRFHGGNEARRDEAVERLKQTAISGGNIFDELLRASDVLSLGQISNALYQVGGAYRRSM
jgi:methylmalonyl-CoA mutase